MPGSWSAPNQVRRKLKVDITCRRTKDNGGWNLVERHEDVVQRAVLEYKVVRVVDHMRSQVRQDFL